MTGPVILPECLLLKGEGGDSAFYLVSIYEFTSTN